MKSQISISGQAVSRRRAANQVKPFHRQKTDSHTRRPGIVSGRYDDPVTVQRLGKTDLSCGLVGRFCSTAVKTTPRPVLERSFRSTDVKRPGDEVDFPVHRDLLVLLFARR
jgi:hypothetical protein